MTIEYLDPELLARARVALEAHQRRGGGGTCSRARRRHRVPRLAGAARSRSGSGLVGEDTALMTFDQRARPALVMFRWFDGE